MTELIVEYDPLEASYHREDAAPLVFPKPHYEVGQLLQDAEGDVVQIIGMEWDILDEYEPPRWKYVIWDVALGIVLDMEYSILQKYTKV